MWCVHVNLDIYSRYIYIYTVYIYILPLFYTPGIACPFGVACFKCFAPLKSNEIIVLKETNIAPGHCREKS